MGGFVAKLADMFLDKNKAWLGMMNMMMMMIVMIVMMLMMMMMKMTMMTMMMMILKLMIFYRLLAGLPGSAPHPFRSSSSLGVP